MKVCQFLNGLQWQNDKNDKKNNLKTSKLNKNLSQIECFQCCLSIVFNSNSVFYFETKWLVEKTCSRALADKTDKCTVSDKQSTGKILILIRLQIF